MLELDGYYRFCEVTILSFMEETCVYMFSGFVLWSVGMNWSNIQRTRHFAYALMHSILDIDYVEKTLSDFLMLIFVSLPLCLLFSE